MTAPAKIPSKTCHDKYISAVGKEDETASSYLSQSICCRVHLLCLSACDQYPGLLSE